ncbi:11919_t:CDS:2, partial [Entrophospora sp. SA101]
PLEAQALEFAAYVSKLKGEPEGNEPLETKITTLLKENKVEQVFQIFAESTSVLLDAPEKGLVDVQNDKAIQKLKVLSTSPLRYDVFIAIIDVVTKNDEIEILLPQLSCLDIWVKEWAITTEQVRELYLKISDKLKEAGESYLKTYAQSEDFSAAKQYIIKAISKSVKNITTDSNRWNENQVYLVKLGEIYTHQYMMSEYIRGLEIYSQSTTTEYKNLLPILTDLGRLWFIHVIHDSLELYLEEGYFTREQVDLVRRAYLDLCKQLREQVIPLVDAWGLPDFIIKAPLGRYDGDIYTAYFDVIRSAPNCIGVPKYWQDHIKPLTSSTTNF